MTDIDNDLVSRAQHGEQDAIRAILEALHRPVIATVFRFLGTRFRSEVEDIAQEVFVKVFRAIDRFEIERGVKFTTWVYTFVRNHCFDVLKRRRLPTVSMTARDGDDDAPVFDPRDERARRPVESVENQELGEKIEEALASLGEDQRLAFVLREYEGLDYAAIAQVTGVSEGTVKSRLHRAKEALRNRLSRYVGHSA
ncbi:MAG: sigma-70 family RNA polymerase sigma factor [Planctomycetes bacterium]|nr:sigma-70 family RNA polymerase sigma factor [Planctomycetota bacterium]